jgi:subtilisin-like proprotein convertase family protein
MCLVVAAVALIVLLAAGLFAVRTTAVRGVNSATAVGMPAGSGSSSASSGVDAAIPDGGAIERSIQQNTGVPARLTALEVRVNVRHPRPQDLEVKLVHPAGTAVVLRPAGDATTPAAMKYDAASHPELGSLVGTGPDGDWKLRVRDTKRGAKGKLMDWGLDLTYAF